MCVCVSQLLISLFLTHTCSFLPLTPAQVCKKERHLHMCVRKRDTCTFITGSRITAPAVSHACLNAPLAAILKASSLVCVCVCVREREREGCRLGRDFEGKLAGMCTCMCVCVCVCVCVCECECEIVYVLDVYVSVCVHKYTQVCIYSYFQKCYTCSYGYFVHILLRNRRHACV